MSKRNPRSPTSVDERHWRAESMVRDAVSQTPAFKRAVKAAERETAKTETAVKRIVQGKGAKKK